MNRSRELLLRQALATNQGLDLESIRLRPLAGGCINQAALLEALHRRWFAKWNDHALPDQFAAEAAGLTALAESGTSLVIPRPLVHRDDGPGRSFLILEYLESGTRGAGFEEALGRGLAELHRCTDSRGFGFEIDGYCGATSQPNGWLPDWIAFYSERRLGHQLRLARRNGLAGTDAQQVSILLDRLPDLLDVGDEPPALIHGDLWSGNLQVTADGRPALIDPAAYFGHREAELGMMVLFGGFGERLFRAYDEAFPLADGWKERLDLYTLYHVLNHFNLFGGGYGAQAMAIVRRHVG